MSRRRTAPRPTAAAPAAAGGRTGPIGAAPGNEGPAISPLNPGTMHRAEDDAAAFATSPEFHERPASPSYTAPTATTTPPSAPRPTKPTD